MKIQLLLPSAIYKNYNSSKLAQKEKKSKEVKNTDKNPNTAASRH